MESTPTQTSKLVFVVFVTNYTTTQLGIRLVYTGYGRKFRWSVLSRQFARPSFEWNLSVDEEKVDNRVIALVAFILT